MEDTGGYTIFEEILNAVTHGLGTLLAVAALTILIIFAAFYGNAWHVVSSCIYGVTMVILYLFSTLYHSFQNQKVKSIFKILDHAAIYLLIAGTYTPFTLVTLHGALGWTIFAVIWALALKSPPARRSKARQGQPRKIKAPIMAKKPRTKRTIGADPRRGLNSLKRYAATKDPKTKPTISGRIYCTTGAWCKPRAPVISRRKQATQMPILGGFPQNCSNGAKIPMTIPTPIILFVPKQ
jgi:chromate transport protein ChrA